MDRETFGERLLDALGDSHEGRELTTDVCNEYYQQFLESKLRFKAWINIILNESGCWDCCADCRTECPSPNSPFSMGVFEMFFRKKSVETLLEETHAQNQLDMFNDAMKREKKRSIKRVYEV